ncbi:MAG TPA: DUF2953 domain-containing protein [Virgibacillus sp.]|nr:DUF2953 domain-containing protein [Virgibacillus sp.]
MPIPWILLLSFVLLIFFILCSRIYFTCHFTYTQQKQVLIIGIYFYRLRLWRREIDLSSNENAATWDIWKDKIFVEGLKHIQKECRTGLEKIRELNSVISLFLRKIRFHDLNWHTHIGTGDASTTGIAAGGVWITKGMIVGFISQQSNLVCRPNTTVKTYFQYKYIQTNIDCIVSIRIGQAITVFLKAMRKDAVQKEALI